jgi:hypothetical protein
VEAVRKPTLKYALHLSLSVYHPQVLSFLRLAAPSWGTISSLLSQFEAVCRLFKVPLAVIDGKAVLLLADDVAAAAAAAAAAGVASAIAGAAGGNGSSVGLPDLLCCFANLDQLEHLFEAGSKAMAAAEAEGTAAAAATAAAAEAAAVKNADEGPPGVAPSCDSSNNTQQQRSPEQQQLHDELCVETATAVGRQLSEDSCQAAAAQWQQQQHPDSQPAADAAAAGPAVQKLQQSMLDSMHQVSGELVLMLNVFLQADNSSFWCWYVICLSLYEAASCCSSNLIGANSMYHVLAMPLPAVVAFMLWLQARRNRDATYGQLQQGLRLHWQQLQQLPHVVLHLPSMPCEQQQQQQQQQLTSGTGWHRPCQQQQQQLWRVLDVIRQQQQQQQQQQHHQQSGDTMVIGGTLANATAAKQAVVALVVDQPVLNQLQAYWMQLLSRAGVQEPEAHVRYWHRMAAVSVTCSVIMYHKAVQTW